MFIELHILQNFAPSNLNRDDTGSPKDCHFGGTRRARISSQSLKRACRQYFKAFNAIPAGKLGVRTKRLHEHLVEQFVRAGRDKDAASQVVETALAGVGVKLKDASDARKTEVLMMLTTQAIESFYTACLKHWDTLVAVASEKPAAEGEAKKSKKAQKAEAKNKVPEAVQSDLEKLFAESSAADLALFGRMLADNADYNVDAACQVAHAISTHTVNMEMDFFTAVDDFKPADNQGADMMGMVEFNSSCFYRFATVGFENLVSNLGGDRELAKASLRAFLMASIHAVPSGKQNTFAAQNLPGYVRVVVRKEGQPMSLANAFLAPVRPSRDASQSIEQLSVERLEDYSQRLATMYGLGAPVADGISSLYCDGNSIPEVIEQTLNALG